MDRLLVVTPKELRFIFEPGEKAHAKIRLHNLMHTMPVAFKIMTTATTKYTATSKAVIIPPLGEHVVEVTMAAQSSLPESFPVSQDRFFVRALVVPTGRATQAELSLWFSTRKKHVFNDATLNVVLTGRFVLCRLAVNSNGNDSSDNIKEVLRDTLVDSRDDQGRSALFLATMHGRLDAVKILADRKADVNIVDKYGHSPLLEAVLSGYIEIVKTLLEAGANIELKDLKGSTCLHAVVTRNRIDLMHLLLDAGANIDATDAQGQTPLHKAVIGGHFKAVALLVQRGADMEKRCGSGTTPLHMAAASGLEDVADLLIQHGAQMHSRTFEGKTPYDLARANGNARLLESSYLQEVMQKAARKNDIHVVLDCLLQGAATDVPDQYGWTALHRASFKGHANMVRLLLKHQFDIDAKDEHGYTPLHCAVEAGHKEIVHLLLQHRAVVSMPTRKKELSHWSLAFVKKHSWLQLLFQEVKPEICTQT